MIEYLEQLVEEKKYREALALAEQLIKQVEDPHQVVRIYAARVVSHCRLGEEQAALAGGDFAMGLAKELGDWDSFGMVTLWVGVAYSRLGQLNEAVTKMYDYLGSLHLYTKAAEHEALARFNLGTWLVALNQPLEATKALSEALATALRANNHRYAHGVRQALIDAHLRAGVYERVPRLLSECGHYLRNQPSMHMGTQSWVFHMKMRAEYALATGRTARAQALSVRGLQRIAGEPVYEFHFHILLARVGERDGISERAFGHTLAARSCAVVGKRPDLEVEASELLLRLGQTMPTGIEAVDRYYMKT